MTDNWNKQHPEYSKKWREDHPNYMRDWKVNHPEYSEYWKKYWGNLKLFVLVHYSGDPPKCACCGESHFEFLTIDHINGGGNQHMKSLRKIGTNLYRWLVNNDFPEGYQVLCWNCNCSKGIGLRHKNQKRFCPVHHPELYDGYNE